MVHGLVYGLVDGTLFMVHGVKIVLDNVLLDHGGLPYVLPFTVHLDLGHHHDTQGYL